MIDLNLLRSEPEIIKDLIKRKDPNYNTEYLINLDKLIRKLKLEIEQLRHKKNLLAQEAQKKLTPKIINESKDLTNILKEKEEKFKLLESEFEDLYLKCPNIIDKDVPLGNKESNLLIREFLKAPNFNFEIKNHLELGKINNWFDFEAAAKMTGSQFALYKNQAVKLIYSLMLYMLNNNISHGYIPILPP